jgi:hypothetical protein
MKSSRFLRVWLACCASASLTLSAAVPRAQTPGSSEPAGNALFRVFLTDGSVLSSFGEVARVGDRVVFSMPTTAIASDRDLQLVNLSADRVDWDRTKRYTDSVRAARYLEYQAPLDYTQVSNQVAATLNAVASIADPAARLAMVERARRTLAEWPASHFNYKADEIRQMLAMLDDAIVDLRAAAGAARFDIAFVAGPSVAPPTEPLLPAPTPKQAIEGMLAAAKAADAPPERTSLYAAALASVARNAAVLPPEWVAATTATAAAAIAHEQQTDRAYQSLTATMLASAKTRAKAADVKGLQRLLEQIYARDADLGASRPDAVKSLLDSVQAELDAAQRLQLARDRWAMRVPDYRRYRASILASLNRFTALKTPLEDIKSLAGSNPFALDGIERAGEAIRKNLTAVTPPDELKDAHALLASAVELADQAARIRREAALTNSITRAWDASAAAAGSLMLAGRARDQLNAALRMPQLAEPQQR